MQYLRFPESPFPVFVGFCHEPINETLPQKLLTYLLLIEYVQIFFSYSLMVALLFIKRRVFKLKINGQGIPESVTREGPGVAQHHKCTTRPNLMRWCGHAKVRHKWIDVGLRYLWLPKLLDKVLIPIVYPCIFSKPPPILRLGAPLAHPPPPWDA